MGVPMPRAPSQAAPAEAASPERRVTTGNPQTADSTDWPERIGTAATAEGQRLEGQRAVRIATSRARDRRHHPPRVRPRPSSGGPRRRRIRRRLESGRRRHGQRSLRRSRPGPIVPPRSASPAEPGHGHDPARSRGPRRRLGQEFGQRPPAKAGQPVEERAGCRQAAFEQPAGVGPSRRSAQDQPGNGASGRRPTGTTTLAVVPQLTMGTSH